MFICKLVVGELVSGRGSEVSGDCGCGRGGGGAQCR